MYPQQPYVESSMYGTPPQNVGMYPPPQPGMYPQQQGPFPGMGPSPQQGPFPGMSPYPQQGGQKKQKSPMGPIGDFSYNVDARLDRIEREIIEINRRLNSLTRRMRRIENFLNIRED